jgi:hypothetical protein
MEARVPEPKRKPGLFYAVSDDGLELPVVDVTHDAFAVDLSATELDRLAQRSLEDLERAQHLPHVLKRFAARKSRIMQSLLAAADAESYASAMVTYLFKVGPEHLTGLSDVDRRLASAFTPVAVRLRLKAMARLLADVVSGPLAGRPGAPLHLVSLGGGTATECTNALLLLAHEQHALLAARCLEVHVLDVDEAGPRFGARALEALSAQAAPLHGLDVRFRFEPWDWRRPGPLGDYVRALAEGGGVVAATSEGGLFEYGTDDDIGATLTALDGSPGLVVLGSVVRDEPRAHRLLELSGMSWHALGAEGVAQIARSVGWQLLQTVGSLPLYELVVLRKA